MIPPRIMGAFNPFKDDREPSFREIQLSSALLVDTIIGCDVRDKELIRTLGPSRTVDRMGIDPNSVSPASLKKVVDASLVHFNAAIRRMRRKPTSGDDFLRNFLFDKSKDCPYIKNLVETENCFNLEANSLRISPSNAEALELCFVGDSFFYPVSLKSLGAFVKSTALLDIFTRLLVSKDGFQCSIPAGSRDSELSHRKRFADGHVDCDIRGKKKARKNDDPLNCVMKCVRESSVADMDAKLQIDTNAPRDRMLDVRGMNEYLEENVKTVHISRPQTDADIPGGYEDMMDWILNGNEAFLVIGRPHGSLTRHAILIDPYLSEVRTRGSSNGLIYDPAADFGRFYRCRDEWNRLGVDVERSAVHIIRKMTRKK